MRKVLKGFPSHLEATVVVSVAPIENDSLRLLIVVLENRRQHELDPNIGNSVRIIFFRRAKSLSMTRRLSSILEICLVTFAASDSAVIRRSLTRDRKVRWIPIRNRQRQVGHRFVRCGPSTERAKAQRLF